MPGDKGVNDRTFIMSVMAERDRRLEAQFAAQENALRLARENLDTRLDHLNGYQKAMAEREKAFLTLEVYNKGHEAMLEKIETLGKAQAASAGAMKVLLPLAAAFGGLVGAVIDRLLLK